MSDHATTNIAAYVKNTGIKISMISRGAQISDNILRRSLVRQERDLRADEFMKICIFLKKNPFDFISFEDGSNYMRAEKGKAPLTDTQVELSTGSNATESSIPGSRKFFEEISVLGAKVKKVHAVLGHVYVLLKAKAGVDVESLRTQYLEACAAKIPLTQTVNVSVEVTD